ncbi:MAG: ketopantoate reductase family protein, partial [Acutalibacteraceae bacterium]
MRITVVGGGNIGTAMCAEFAEHGHTVSLLTSKPDRFGEVLSVWNEDEGKEYSGRMQKISDRAQDVLPDAQVVIVTLPAFLMPAFAQSSLAHMVPGTILVAMPGYGGVEFMFRKHVQKGVILVGFQRVPAVYRLIEYGRISRLSGRRAELLYATMPNRVPDCVQSTLETVFSMPCRKLPNFLSVTLTPSNPILHTTRLYALFHTLSPEATLEENPC